MLGAIALWCDAQISLCDDPNFSLVKDFNDTSHVHPLVSSTAVFKDVFFYTFDDGDIGTWIWRSDGDNNGIYRLPHIENTGALSYPDQLTMFGDYLYFTAFSEQLGCELWRMYVASSNPGTPELINDINPGQLSSLPSQLFIFNDLICFTATRDDIGVEFWVYDPSTEQSGKFDILSGPESSHPSDLIATTLHLFFSADGGHGITTVNTSVMRPSIVIGRTSWKN